VPKKKITPAQTAEAREAQLINAAVNLAEKQLQDGSASSGVIIHYLKLATEKERLAAKKLEEEVKLVEAKTKSIADEGEKAAKYEEAIAALKSYGGD